MNACFLRIFVWSGIAAWVLCPGLGYSLSNEDIFAWTMQRMKIEQPVSPPEIKWVDRAELNQVFTDHNRNAYLQWETQFGSDQAQAIMRTFLDEILGMFVVQTQVVYIGSFLEPCHRQAILAHEFVHYLQHTTRGVVTGYGEETEKLKWMRELEAQNIEAMFMEQFCESPQACCGRPGNFTWRRPPAV